MKNINKNQGFTLIELVVVIVILGILAVTAAPKFIDLTGDAKKAVMEGVQGSIKSAVNLAHAKALVSGETKATGEIQIGSKYYALAYGYPVADPLGDGSASGAGLAIDSLLELDTNTPITSAVVLGSAEFAHSKATTAATCKITYTDTSNAETPPEVEATLGGC
ncbi:MAG: pilus assembly FimT family protein [Thalassotalea sp.]|mgnify:CR=1 FL=1